MRLSEAARRYAKALYETTKMHKTNDQTLAELRVLKNIFQSDAPTTEYFSSPLISADLKTTAVKKAFEGKVSPAVFNTLALMGEKERLSVFSQMVAAFEEISDADHGVTRGTVRAAKPLNSEDQKRIEDKVMQVTGKKVILNFTEDPKLLGGMVAQVGGWTFDDSLLSHLRRMQEELHRRAI